MIDSVKIDNFRGFAELEVNGLKPINILVGDNSSGKTAFLEAILLSSAAVPQIAFQLNEWRQLGRHIELRMDASSYWGLWEGLFHQYDLSRSIRIEVVGSADSSRTL